MPPLAAPAIPLNQGIPDTDKRGKAVLRLGRRDGLKMFPDDLQDRLSLPRA
jgi:hypothetical protein